VACLLLLLFLPYDFGALSLSAISALAAVLCLCWTVSFPNERIFSPYQILELGPSDHGWMTMRAAGQYYQRILDLSNRSQEVYPDLRKLARYYNLPYAVKTSPKSVLVVGAGTGNDVAAALRAGAERVVAVEIDPAIIALGVNFHPEKPYQNPKVVSINDDARAFLRNSKESFDLIVFGLLDSHTTASNASSLRLDSYVYTLESLKEARAHLNAGGVLSLSFSVVTAELACKVSRMLEKAFDEKPPVCLGGEYDVSYSFLQARDGGLQIPSTTLKTLQFIDLTSMIARARANVDVSDDNWPFFYMPHRVWPISYIPLVLLIAGFTYLLISSLQGQRLSVKRPAYFLLGAGFMLVETKAITELCLYFGSTWTVTAITISSILLMAFLSNLAVIVLKIERAQPALLILILSLSGGLWFASHGGMPLTLAGKVGEVLLVTCPVFFSGVAFSCLLKKADSVSHALSENIFGAIAGGMLEYSAMYLGYRALYVIAMVIYALALLSSLKSAKSVPVFENIGQA
jgi:SAM-dependent methyltransferase